MPLGILELCNTSGQKIRDAAIQVGELEALEAKYALASNAHRILELTSVKFITARRRRRLDSDSVGSMRARCES